MSRLRSSATVVRVFAIAPAKEPYIVGVSLEFFDHSIQSVRLAVHPHDRPRGSRGGDAHGPVEIIGRRPAGLGA